MGRGTPVTVTFAALRSRGGPGGLGFGLRLSGGAGEDRGQEHRTPRPSVCRARIRRAAPTGGPVRRV